MDVTFAMGIGAGLCVGIIFHLVTLAPKVERTFKDGYELGYGKGRIEGRLQEKNFRDKVKLSGK